MRSDKGIRLPWSGADMPHAALDLLRGCNVTCEGCYNARAPRVKPLSQIRDELDQLMGLRRLQTVTLTGGEPTLHPQLIEIARLVKSRNLRLSMLTNGLLLDAGLAAQLAEAGMDIVLLHIQSGQQRADLPPDPTTGQIRELRALKARLVTKAGMEVGTTGISYPGRQDEVRALIEEVTTSPDLSFVLLCRRCNLGKFERVRGHIGTHMTAQVRSENEQRTLASVEMPADPFNAVLADCGLSPYAYIGSSRDPGHPMWISYFVVVLTDGSGRHRRFCVRPSGIDLLLMAMMKRLHGRYVFFFKASPAMFRARLLLSAVFNPRNLPLLRMIAASQRPGSVLREKHIVIEHSPELMPDGEVVYCRECPDATVVNGKLMPPCLADRADETADMGRPSP